MKKLFKKNNKIWFSKKTGFTIVEVLVACAIITTTILALMAATSKGIELSNKALKQTQASMLIEEGVEVVKSIRDSDWGIISGLNSDPYFLSFDTSTNTWTLVETPGSEIDGVFSRNIIFSEVYRDTNDDIALSGTLDDGTKKVEVIVGWPSKNGINSKNITFYLTNIFN